jgi:uncharacterized DUF497 family protein
MDALLNCFAENNINISHLESFETRGEIMFEWMGSTFLAGEFADSFYIAEYIEGKEEYEFLAEGVKLGDIVEILKTYQDQEVQVEQEEQEDQEERKGIVGLTRVEIASYIAIYLKPYDGLRDWTGSVPLTEASATHWGYSLLDAWGYEFRLAGRCFRIIYSWEADNLELLERIPIEDEQDSDEFDAVIIGHIKGETMEQIALFIEDIIF